MKYFFTKSPKNPGISLLIVLGTSLFVLSGAMLTINSVSQSLEQASNIERSTQFFFAAESGIESAFFHHNARGPGTQFENETESSQKINHPETSAQTTWTIKSRTNPVIGLLHEGTSVQIPLFGDSSTNPTNTNTPTAVLNFLTETLSFSFYPSSATLPENPSVAGDIEDTFINNFGEIANISIDFGNINNEVLIDWSFSRENSNKGIQTFSPTENNDCSNSSPDNIDGFICEDQLTTATETSFPKIISSDPIDGRVLPGGIGGDDDLKEFLDCTDSMVSIGDTCKNYTLTFRPLLLFKDSPTDDKIKGIPFVISSSNLAIDLPKDKYTVKSTVSMGNFEQSISLDVPEKTSLGAFDYVIFD
ncbi:hypothetical protein KAI58_01270 [Candidatus Gracilibacteria bacterium]|nr:hypothetical protein [Candidatus Gracilibacteria bacterium]